MHKYAYKHVTGNMRVNENIQITIKRKQAAYSKRPSTTITKIEVRKSAAIIPLQRLLILGEFIIKLSLTTLYYRLLHFILVFGHQYR